MIRKINLDKVKQSRLFWGSIIFCIAIVLRLTHVISINMNSPFFDILPGDLGSYDNWAAKIVKEGWLGKEIFYQDPLYPYFLALIYKTIGRDFALIYGIQALLGSATAVLIYLIANKSIDPTAGIIGGLLYSFYAPAIYFDGLLLKVTLSAFLFTSCVFLLLNNKLDKPRLGQFLSGCFLGLTILTRANFLLVIPAVVLVVLISKESFIKQRLLIIGLFILGNLLILSPVLLRNYVVGHDWTLTTSQAGQNFYIGNNPRANGTYISPPFVRPDPMYEQQDFHKEAVKRLQRPLKPSEASDYWFQQGLAFIRNNPGAFLRLTSKKLGIFLNNYEMADNHNFYFHKRYSRILDLSPVTFGLVGPFFLLGLFVMVKQKKIETRILSLTQVTYIFSVIIFYVLSRYRMPVLPFFCLTAGYAMSDLVNQFASSQWKSVTVKLITLICAFVVVYLPLTKPFDFSHSYTDEAIAYEYKGNCQKAIQSYEKAIQVNPRYVRAIKRLGRTQIRLKYYEDARNTYQRLLALEPNSREAHIQLRFLQEMIKLNR